MYCILLVGFKRVIVIYVQCIKSGYLFAIQFMQLQHIVKNCLFMIQLKDYVILDNLIDNRAEITDSIIM